MDNTSLNSTLQIRDMEKTFEEYLTDKELFYKQKINERLEENMDGQIFSLSDTPLSIIQEYVKEIFMIQRSRAMYNDYIIKKSLIDTMVVRWIV